MFVRFVAIVITTLFTTTLYAAGCDGILSLTRNSNYEAKSTVVAQSIYEQYCSGNSLKNDKKFSLGLDVVIKSVPVALNLGSGSIEERVEHLCSEYQDWYNLNTQSISLAISTSD